MLVLVKGDRRTGSQVSPTTHMILVLVKGDRRTRSQVSPTMQILVLVQGDRPMGSHKKKKTFRVFLYKAYYAKHLGVLLRKHCKEGASVATQFLTHVLIKIEKSKTSEKTLKIQKIHFLYICIVFSIF